MVHTESRRHRVAAMREKLTTEDAGKHRELRKPKLFVLFVVKVLRPAAMVSVDFLECSELSELSSATERGPHGFTRSH